MDDKPPRRFSPEMIIFGFSVIFYAGVVFSNGNANADRVNTLENHDREYGQMIAAMKQEIDDLADHFGIPKRGMPFYGETSGKDRP